MMVHPSVAALVPLRVALRGEHILTSVAVVHQDSNLISDYNTHFIVSYMSHSKLH